jgi:hypothetical protein
LKRSLPYPSHLGAQPARESRTSAILKQALPPPLGCGSYADSRQPATPGRRPGRLPDAQTAAGLESAAAEAMELKSKLSVASDSLDSF